MDQIGAFMAAIIAPWSLKWLWAPLIDLIRVRRYGADRFWICLTQILMAVTLAFLFILDPSEDLALLTIIMVIHNVCSSAQDVAIDGFAVRVLPDSELSDANGAMFAAQRFGMAIGGGGSLYIAGQFGFNAAFAFVLAGLLVILFGVSMRLPEAPDKVGPGARADSFVIALGRSLKTFFRELRVGFFQSGRGPRVGVLFSLLPAGAMALGYGISSALQVDLGFSDSQISLATTLTLFAGAIGSGCSGFWTRLLGMRRALALIHVLTALPTLAMAFMIWTSGVSEVGFWPYIVVASAYQFFFGALFGIVGAVTMTLTNPAVGATQYTGYNSLKNLSIGYSSWWQGLVVAAAGYPAALAIDAGVALLPIALIPFLIPSTSRGTRTA